MSALLSCPACSSDDIYLIEILDDGRKRVECAACGQLWLHGTAPAPTIVRPNTYDALKGRFTKADDVDPRQLAHVDELKARFLTTVQSVPEHAVAPYWAKYQRVFSAEGLQECDPQDLKDFANSNIGANPGNMSVFNTAWNTIGAEAAAARTRAVIEYLLRGPEHVPVEDRLTNLITGGGTSPEMPGFKESLLVRVLCIVEPQRYLTILKYTGVAGKREIARAVYGLELPSPERVSWTIGRLILWSNDLLIDLLGEEFTHQQHAAHFLWWAKDQKWSVPR